MKNKLIILFAIASIYASCQEKEEIAKPVSTFSVESVKSVIVQNSLQWNKGLKTKDISVFLDLYDEDAHYLPNEDNALHGNKAIANYWKNSWDFVKDLNLNMETLEGTEELLYETGNGNIQAMNDIGKYDKIQFKYVNVWKKQTDNSYKVVIDIFNELKKN